MYQIIKHGAVLALTEKPIYICLHEEGFYALCTEADAQGIAVSGHAYSLHGRSPMDGCETVQLIELDAGGILAQTQADTDATLLMVQLAVAELAETQATDQTANELALAELAETIGG